MSDINALFTLLRSAANKRAADLLKELIEVGPNRDLNRINALAFAAKHDVGLNIEAARSKTSPSQAGPTAAGTSAPGSTPGLWTNG